MCPEWVRRLSAEARACAGCSPGKRRLSVPQDRARVRKRPRIVPASSRVMRRVVPSHGPAGAHARQVEREGWPHRCPDESCRTPTRSAPHPSSRPASSPVESRAVPTPFAARAPTNRESSALPVSPFSTPAPVNRARAARGVQTREDASEVRSQRESTRAGRDRTRVSRRLRTPRGHRPLDKRKPTTPEARPPQGRDRQTTSLKERVKRSKPTPDRVGREPASAPPVLPNERSCTGCPRWTVVPSRGGLIADRRCPIGRTWRLRDRFARSSCGQQLSPLGAF